jgi:uncharacterized repeat protein (TIGR01451 family)
MKKLLSLLILSIFLSLPTILKAQCFGGNISAIRDTICQGTPGNMTLTGYLSDTVIQWQYAVGTPDSFADVIGATNIKYKTPPLQQTTYYRAVVDSGSCSAISDTFQLYVPPVIISSFYFIDSGNTVTFNSDSSVGAIKSYQWDFDDNSTSTERNPVHVFSKDTIYYVCLTLYDGSNCSYTFCRYIQTSNTINIGESSSNPTCGNSDGYIIINQVTGTSPFNYLWSNGATTQNLNNLPAGNYGVTVTDAHGYTGSALVALSNSTGPVISSTQTNTLSSTDSSGNIFISVSGGRSPYSTLWSNGAVNDSLFNLSAGNYSVTITDAAGCLALQNFTIIAGFSSNFYVYISGNQPNCSNNGSLNASVYGGIPPYTYLWSNSETEQSINGLGTGNYYVTVTDVNGRKGIGYYFLQGDCFNLIQGRVFNDANNNCIFDAGDSPIPSAVVTATSGSNQFYGYTNYDGTYSIYIPSSGSYQITATFNSYNNGCGNIVPCTSSNNRVTFNNSGGDTSIFSMGFAGSSGYDLTIHPGWTSAKPGFQKEYWVMPFNQAYSNNFTGSATVVFKYDSALIYQNSLAPQPVNDPVAHTLTWVVNNVPYPTYDWTNARFENFFTVPASLPLGYQLQSDFYITPTSGDCDTSNNHFHFSEDVTGSHDPNEKEVSPSGDIRPEDSILTYTIHFQNDGTDTTNFIIVRDTLSSYLNAASAQTIASSHPYQEFYVSGKGVLNWVFNPIYLVDSSTNVAASKGFVSFRIKKQPNLPLNTVIPNKASIFFDYNGAVITNTVTNTITTGIKTITGKNNVSVNVYPNPFSETSTFEVTGLQGDYSFTLSNVLGEKVQELTTISSSRFDINRRNLNAGIYFFSIVANGKTVANGKVVVQ